MTDQTSSGHSSPTEEKKESFIGIIMHSFFVIPFLIAVFGILLFAAVRLLTLEPRSPYDYLNDIKSGGSTKRWQSAFMLSNMRWQAAFELSKHLSTDNNIVNDEKFISELIGVFKQSVHDDNRVRQYLALAMAKTGNKRFVEPILDSLKGEREENLYSFIYALGVLADNRASPQIEKYLDHPDSKIRLAAVMALGNIADLRSKKSLIKALSDPEANVTWDAAIALAKMNDSSGKSILLKMLRRDYLSGYPEIDLIEKNHIMTVTIQAAGPLGDEDILDQIKLLSQIDPNFNVRKAALGILNNPKINSSK